MIHPAAPALSEKQLHILLVAEELFALHGFDGTSVRDIAEKAGVNLAMISYYFQSKEKLMETLFTMRTQQFHFELNKLINDSNRSSLEKVNYVIDYYTEKLQKHGNFHKIMVREQQSVDKTYITEKIVELKKTNLAILQNLIRHGQKAGEFNNVDIKFLMSTLMGTVNHVLTTWHIYRELDDQSGVEEKAYKDHLTKKLKQYLKSIFKIILTHE